MHCKHQRFQHLYRIIFTEKKTLFNTKNLQNQSNAIFHQMTSDYHTQEHHNANIITRASTFGTDKEETDAQCLRPTMTMMMSFSANDDRWLLTSWRMQLPINLADESRPVEESADGRRWCSMLTSDEKCKCES